MDGGPGRCDRQGRLVAKHRRLHHLGRLRRVVRPRHPAAGREVEGRYGIPPGVSRWVSGPQPLRQTQIHLTHPTLPREPGEVLRDDVRSARDQRPRQGRRRYVRLLRFLAEASASTTTRDLTRYFPPPLAGEGRVGVLKLRAAMAQIACLILGALLGFSLLEPSISTLLFLPAALLL